MKEPSDAKTPIKSKNIVRKKVLFAVNVGPQTRAIIPKIAQAMGLNVTEWTAKALADALIRDIAHVRPDMERRGDRMPGVESMIRLEARTRAEIRVAKVEAENRRRAEVIKNA